MIGPPTRPLHARISSGADRATAGRFVRARGWLWGGTAGCVSLGRAGTIARMGTFLFKTEPGDFGFDDLKRAGPSVWDGVSNPAALIVLRTCRKGDDVFVYHTGDERAIVGLATITRGAQEDPKRPGLNDRGEPKFAVVTCKAVRAAKPPLTLAEMKSEAAFEGFDLLRLPRLSVMAVPAKIEQAIRRRTGL